MVRVGVRVRVRVRVRVHGEARTGERRACLMPGV